MLNIRITEWLKGKRRNGYEVERIKGRIEY